MNWTDSPHYSESNDGLWRVTKACVRHKTKEVLRYRLWLRERAVRGKWTPMGLFDSGDAAKEMAEIASLDDNREEI